MASHDYSYTLIVGDLIQHLVQRAFTELTVVYELTIHVEFPTCTRGSLFDPVLADLPADMV